MDIGKIQLACMSLMWGGSTLPSKDAAGWLDDVAAAGFDGVSLFHSELILFMKELAFPSLLRERKLTLASVNHPVDSDLGALRKTCEAMNLLGATHLVAVGGIASRGADPASVADVLNRMGETALEYGIRVGYHNHTNHTGETLEEVEGLLSLTDPEKIYGFLDTGHATRDFTGYARGERAGLFLMRNWDRMDLIELKDWSEEHDLCTDIGAGACDFSRVFAILKEKCYGGWLGVEQNGPMGNKTPLESASASCQFIRSRLGV